MTMNTNKPAQCRFDELSIGEQFHLVMTHTYGSTTLFVKETATNARVIGRDPGNHPVPADTQVVRVRDTTIIKSEAEDNTIKSDGFTMVMLKASMYMFQDIELEGNEWIELQEDDSIYTVPLPIEHLAMLIDKRGQYCFIFWDEAGQCSQPYPTVQDAMAARKHYIAQL